MLNYPSDYAAEELFFVNPQLRCVSYFSTLSILSASFGEKKKSSPGTKKIITEKIYKQKQNMIQKTEQGVSY